MVQPLFTAPWLVFLGGGHHFPDIARNLLWVGAKKRAAQAMNTAIASPPVVTKSSMVGPSNPVED